MGDKRYTAQEMRDTLKCLYVNMVVGMRGLYCVVNSNEVIAMLRQAADMVERANERRGMFAANYGRVDYEVDSAIVDEIDYIIRGDAEEGAEDGRT